MNDAWASDVIVGETPAEAPRPVSAGARRQSGALTSIFALLVFHFLYFASPILIPIIVALLLSMLLAPFVALLDRRVRAPRTLGALIVVAAAVGALLGIATSLRGPAQSWLSEPQRFSHLEEKVRPIMASFEILQYATEQLENAAAPRDRPSIQKVELTGSGLSSLLSTGMGMWRPRAAPSSASLTCFSSLGTLSWGNWSR